MNKEQVTALINSKIKANGEGDITASVLKEILLAINTKEEETPTPAESDVIVIEETPHLSDGGTLQFTEEQFDRIINKLFGHSIDSATLSADILALTKPVYLTPFTFDDGEGEPNRVMGGMFLISDICPVDQSFCLYFINPLYTNRKVVLLDQ